MSTQTVIGIAHTAEGSYPLSASITDGEDDQELTTNTTYTVTAQSLGTIAENETLVKLSLSAATGIAYAGVLRNGQYIALCQSFGSYSLGANPPSLPVLPSPVRLVAGDQIIVRTEA